MSLFLICLRYIYANQLHTILCFFFTSWQQFHIIETSESLLNTLVEPTTFHGINKLQQEQPLFAQQTGSVSSKIP